MNPLTEEIVNLTMWTCAVGFLFLMLGVKWGQRLQRWMNDDAIDHNAQAFEDGRQIGWEEAAIHHLALQNEDPTLFDLQ